MHSHPADTHDRGWLGRLLVLPFLLALVAPAALAADVYLVAREYRKTMPDGVKIKMWGFARDLDGDLATDFGEEPTVPGPVIRVSATDSALNIHLRNDLSVPVSIIIPGQITPLSPVTVVDAQGRMRVTSFTHEAAPGGGTALYSWGNVRPGTYLYQSGTHPAVQVQMGLYGAVKKDAAPQQAYADAGTAYDYELTLVYSEIDPALHHAVDIGSYGSPDYPSTMNYRPRYFLINGQPFAQGQKPVPAGKMKKTTLIRFLNAGLESHTPVLLGQSMSIIAEDGNAYGHARSGYALFLPAGKTRDVLVKPVASGSFALFDRSLRLTSDEASPGGMLLHLRFGASNRAMIPH